MLPGLAPELSDIREVAWCHTFGGELQNALDSLGVCHGFRVISDSAHLFYETTGSIIPNASARSRGMIQSLGLIGNSTGNLSSRAKDQNGMLFHDAKKFE
jgi:hypothetical protein